MAVQTANGTSICMHPSSATERRRLSRMTKSGKAVRVARGIYAPAADWSNLDEIARANNTANALAALHPNWVFCLFTAAALYGLEIGRDYAMPLHAQTPHSEETRNSPTLIRHPITCINPTLIGETRVTPPAQTVVDCLIRLPFARGLAVADSALRVLRLTKEELLAELASRPTYEQLKVAENAILHANPLAANGGESVARAVMLEQGFMIPALQAQVTAPLDQGKRYFVDFLWRLATGDVIGELDGKDKYVLTEMTGGKDTLEVMLDERHRESRITAPGVKVLRFSFRDVMDKGRFVSLLKLYGIPRGPAQNMGG